MGGSMSQEKWKHYQRREVRKRNEPPKTLGTRIQNQPQMGKLPGGSPADSPPNLLPQSVSSLRRTGLGSGVHSHPDPHFP